MLSQARTSLVQNVLIDAPVMHMKLSDPQRSVDTTTLLHSTGRVAKGRTDLLAPRLDFRHLSSHISQRKPGYYLVLLRSEIRHRSLREKPAVTE